MNEERLEVTVSETFHSIRRDSMRERARGVTQSSSVGIG